MGILVLSGMPLEIPPPTENIQENAAKMLAQEATVLEVPKLEARRRWKNFTKEISP